MAAAAPMPPSCYAGKSGANDFSAVRPRSDDERLAQKQALELLERARLG